ncbi:MAG TPA: hypothetical protein VKB67_15750 [Rhizomicrobium sp.]|nr:hypothetical protein [Rhizomicrobium sp.]
MNLKTAAMLTALGSALAVSSAHAAITARFDIGNVAIGYTDGYYDNDHHWHHWRHHADLEQFRASHGDMYHEWRHNDRRHHDEH